jgi:UDP-N-acetylglucosamine 2-epimerase (non-hydrolysing)
VRQDYAFQSSGLRAIDSDPNRHTLLVTAHRRENHGEPLQDICAALRQLLETRPDLRLVLPVHLNPNVHDTVHGMLGDLEHAYLVDPLNYEDFVNLMAQAHIVLTDSGGVQEEAPSLGKPVLVLRETTERPEAISAGTACLVGTSRHRIVEEVTRLLDDPAAYHRMAQAAHRTVEAIRYYFGLVDSQPVPFGMTG